MTLKAKPTVSDVCIGSFHERSICEAGCLSLSLHVGIIKCSAPIFMRTMFTKMFWGLATSIRNWDKFCIQMRIAALPEWQNEGHPRLIQLDCRQLLSLVGSFENQRASSLSVRFCADSRSDLDRNVASIRGKCDETLLCQGVILQGVN